ncbi:MAG TPA: hypothetical protein VMA37_15400 [Acetobacteraceae bacterium]|nr:hypothetical protein [Acetobacteraceae bacterium]
MPVIDIAGIALTLSPDEARVAQSCIGTLTQAAIALTADPGKWDSRLQPALSTRELAPLFKRLVEFLSQSDSLLKEAERRSGSDAGSIGDSAWSPEATLEDLIQRYLDSVTTGLGRLLKDWDHLGPLFFTTGEEPSLIAFQPKSLIRIVPEDDALSQGGTPSLALHLLLQRIGGVQTASETVSGRIVYLPRDVEADYALMGDTRRICAAAGSYSPTTAPCAHVWCRSMAERINATIGEQGAVPTFVIWPAQPASKLGRFSDEAYGYRECLAPDSPQGSAASPDSQAGKDDFFRTLGRQLGVAYAFCIRAIARDFVVHGGRPYWVNLSYAFEAPFADLAATGMFAPGAGPLGSPATASAKAGLPASPAGHAEVIGRGCLDVLEAIAVLADEFTQRLQLGGDIVTRYRPRSVSAGQDRQERMLDLLATIRSWNGWHALERLTSGWRNEEDAAWTRSWFSLALNEIKRQTGTGSNTIPVSARETIEASRDRLSALVGASKFEEIGISDILVLSPADRETAWTELVALASYLTGLQEGTGWDPGLETRWGALPSFALVRFELADHLRARLPFFVRPLQGATLYFPEDGTEVRVQQIADPPPPRLQRDSYFPRPMALEMESRLSLLQNAGVRMRLVEEIGRLANG